MGASTCLCSLCNVCGATERIYSRIGYVLFAFVWIVISTLLLFFAHYVLDGTFIGKYLSCTDGSADVCLGISTVYRVSFALAIFHGFMGLLCTCGGELVNKLNEGAWPIKFVLVAGLFGLSFLIPNGFFQVYGYIAMVPSFLFIIYEMILIIDMAYAWNSNWVGKLDNSEPTGCSAKCWGALIIIFTIIFFGAAILIYVMLFRYEYDNGKPVGNLIVIGLSVLAAIVYTGLSISPLVEGGSIFTCSLIFFFISVITASVMFSDPSQSSPRLLVLQIVIGLGFMFFALFYVGAQTVQAATSSSAEKPAAQQMTGKVANALAETSDAGEAREKFTSQDKEAAPEVTMKTALFHLLMLLASIYYSMVITNWGAPKIESDVNPDTSFSNEWVGYGVTLAAQWMGILLFLWSLLAPRICPARQFT